MTDHDQQRHPLRRAVVRAGRMLFGTFIFVTFAFGMAVWVALLLQIL